MPPAEVAPRGVRGLSATVSQGEVTLTWEAPQRDRRGKRLREIVDFLVVRSVISDERAQSESVVVATLSADPTLSSYSHRDTLPVSRGIVTYEVIARGERQAPGELERRIRVTLIPGKTPSIDKLDFQPGEVDEVKRLAEVDGL